MTRCPLCNSIWFWSPFVIGNLKCCNCEPIDELPHQGPGIIRPDGTLLTAKTIDEEIVQFNHLAKVRSARAALDGDWELVKSTLLIMEISRPTAAGCFQSLVDIPQHLVMTPDNPNYVHRSVEDQAISDHQLRVRAPRASGASAAVQTDKMDVLKNQVTRSKKSLKNKP